MEVLGTRTWPDSFSCFSVSLCYLFASFDDWGEDSISPRVSSSQHCLVSPAGWQAVSFWSSVGEEYSYRCVAFTGPSNNQEGAYHSLLVTVVSWLQGLFVYNIRSVVICLLAFAAFLRFDELAKLVRSDVKIENEMLKLFIHSSKTDQ